MVVVLPQARQTIQYALYLFGVDIRIHGSRMVVWTSTQVQSNNHAKRCGSASWPERAPERFSHGASLPPVTEKGRVLPTVLPRMGGHAQLRQLSGELRQRVGWLRGL